MGIGKLCFRRCVLVALQPGTSQRTSVINVGKRQTSLKYMIIDIMQQHKTHIIYIYIASCRAGTTVQMFFESLFITCHLFCIYHLHMVPPKISSQNLEAKMCAKHCKYHCFCTKHRFWGGQPYIYIYTHINVHFFLQIRLSIQPTLSAD